MEAQEGVAQAEGEREEKYIKGGQRGQKNNGHCAGDSWSPYSQFI